MNISDLPDDIIQYIVLKYIDNSNVNKKRLQIMGSHKINSILENVELAVQNVS